MLFGKKGFDGSSINEVAATVGMSKAAVFHYFPTKRDIYDAIIVRTLEGLNERVGEAIASKSTGLDRLKCFMHAHAAYFEENFWSFVTMLIGYGGMATPTLKDEALHLRDAHEARLRQILVEGMASGELRDLDPAETGRAILSMLNWMARWFTPGGGQSATQVADNYFLMIVGGLERR